MTRRSTATERAPSPFPLIYDYSRVSWVYIPQNPASRDVAGRRRGAGGVGGQLHGTRRRALPSRAGPLHGMRTLHAGHATLVYAARRTV